MRPKSRHNNAGCVAVTVAFILRVYGDACIHYGYAYSTQCHFIKHEFTQGRFALKIEHFPSPVHYQAASAKVWIYASRQVSDQSCFSAPSRP